MKSGVTAALQWQLQGNGPLRGSRRTAWAGQGREFFKTGDNDYDDDDDDDLTEFLV